MTVKLSLVIPVYSEKESLEPLSLELGSVLKTIPLESEVLFVDDGSTDGSDRVLEEICSKNPRWRQIRLRRNFGKSAAYECGFKRARGEIIVTLDADLQDDPSEIPRLLEKLNEGFDLVAGWKKKRYDPWNKRMPSRLFNAVTSFFFGIRLHDFNCGLKAYRRALLREVDVYGELHRYLPVLAGWRGFRIAEIEVRHRPRIHGRTKFGAGRYLSGLLDLGTAYYVTRFSKKPSRIFGTLGLGMFFLGALMDLHIFFIKISGGMIGNRLPYMMMAILLTILGVQFLFVGLLSELMVYFYHRFKKEYSVEYEQP